ncbi:protein with putative role during mitosis [Actinomortierella wolfii]|nr:protein with putative role during mitosis [Actinomortierella wolfii]
MANQAHSSSQTPASHAILADEEEEPEVEFLHTPSPSLLCPVAFGCTYKGTTREAKEHLASCVFEKLKGYIEATNARFSQMEKVLETQAREIERLQKILRAGKTLALDHLGAHGDSLASPSASGPLSSSSSSHSLVNGDVAINGVIDGIGEGSSSDVIAGGSSSSSGGVRSVVSTFPHDEITCHRTITEHKCGVTSVAVHNDILFAGAHDGSTKVFAIESGRLLKSFKSHTMSVWGLAIAQTGERFFSAGSDGTIKVWDWRKGGEGLSEAEDEAACLVATIPDHHAKVYGLVVDQGRLYSASSDKTVKVWDVETLECLATFQGHTGGVNSLTALKGAYAGQLATGSSDKTIKIWDVTTGTCIKTVRRGTSEVLDVAAGDGMLFGSTYDAVVHVYDLNETRELGTLSGHNWEVWQLEYGEGHLFSASFDHTIKRWDPRRFQCDLTLKGHKSFVHGMALTDKYLVTGCADRTIKIWR